MELVEIVEKIKKIHELSHYISKCEKLLDEFPNRKEKIKCWINEDKKTVEDLQNEVIGPLVDKYKSDVMGKYFCNINTCSSDYDYIMFIHVDDVFTEKKSVYHKYDLVCKQLGEFLFVEMSKEGEIKKIDYTKHTEFFDFKGAYLSSHHLYGILPEGLNGWNEINKDTYEAIVSKYRNNVFIPEYNLNTLKEHCKDFFPES